MSSHSLPSSVVPALTPRHPLLGHPVLPEWVADFRPHQRQALEGIADAFTAGFTHVLLDAPTGSGKTLLGEVASRMLRDAPTLYVATTKSLQEQYAADFPYAKILKGRSNYPTLDFPQRHGHRLQPLSCLDCDMTSSTLPACSGCPPVGVEASGAMPHCSWCHPVESCPYAIAKAEALQAPLACTNTAYFLTEANKVGKLSKRALIVIDECDTLESLVMGQVEVEIGQRLRREIGLDSLPRLKTKPESWAEWIELDAMPRIERARVEAMAAVRSSATTQLTRRLRRLIDLNSRVKNLYTELTQGEATWVYDSKAHDKGHAIFRPVRVDHIAPEMVFSHSDRFLHMSATLIDPTEYTESLGIPAGTWTLVTVGSTFPRENRPIHIIPGVTMAYKTKAENMPKMVTQVARVLDRHPRERVLIHTVSYELAQYIWDGLRNTRPDLFLRLVIYSSADERHLALDRYKSVPASVMIAPSMDRGIDLPGELCDVVVIAKIPHPNMGDPQVSARSYSRGGELWYQVQTVRTIVQMTGRGVRSATDTCTTYILDGQFLDNTWRKSKRLFPRWWTEALSFDPSVLDMEVAR